MRLTLAQNVSPCLYIVCYGLVKSCCFMTLQAWRLYRELLVLLHCSHACCTFMRRQTSSVVPRLFLRFFFCSCGLLVVLMRLLHSWSLAWSCYSLVQWWFQSHYAFVSPFYMLPTRVGWQIRQIRKIWWFSLCDCILWKLNAVSTVLNCIKRTIAVFFFNRMLALVACTLRYLLYVPVITMWCSCQMSIAVFVYSKMKQCILLKEHECELAVDRPNVNVAPQVSK